MARQFSQWKEKEWAAPAATVLTLTGDGISIGSSITFAASATVMRMLFSVKIGATAAPAALDQVQFSFGIAKVSGDAAALGSSAMPDPVGESDFPWLFWDSTVLHFAGTDPQSASPMAVFDRSYDIRSMRKFKPREVLAWVVQYVNITGNPPITFAVGQARLLIAVS